MDRKSPGRYASLVGSWYGDRPARGFSVTLEVAFRCNVRCVFCSRWSDPTDLKLETIEQIAEDMKRLDAAYVSLTGGDPFVRADIRQIIDAFAERGVPIHINTNGVLLKKQADFLRSRAQAIRGITVSIDSPDAAMHDEIRGVRGTFERAVAGMEALRDVIPFSLACTLNQKNLHEIEAYDRFAKRLGYDYRFQPLHDDGDNQLAPNQDGVEVEQGELDGLTDRLESVLEPRDSMAKRQYYRLFEPFFRNRERMDTLRCTTAARLIYFIDPQGDVFPCDTRRDVKLGNVYRQRLAEIVAGRESNDWRGTCRKGENGCWCMYACVAPNNLRYQDLPLMPLGTEGGPLRRRWNKRLASFDSAPTAGELPAPVEAAADSTMRQWPVVGIVVASYNGGDFLDRNVESLLALDYPPDRRQIVLVDDASDDGSVDRAEARFADAIDRGELRIVRNERSLGVPGAYNRGVRASRPDARYVLKSDNDVLPEPDALKQLVAAAEANPRAGIVGGRIYYHDDRERLQFVGGRLDSITRGPALIGTPPELLRDPAGSPSRWMDVVNSCLALIRRRVFEHSGLFPEFYGRYEYEDYDFTFKARRLGYGALYCPRAVGYHAVSLTSDANDLTTFRLRQRARNGVIFMARCAPRGWLAGFLTYQLAKIPFDFLRHGHPPGTLISGYLEGVRRVRQGGFTTEHLPPPPAPEPRSDLHVVNASGL